MIQLPGLVRTFVPMIVGWLLSLPVIAGLNIDSAAMEGLVTTIVGFAYYLIVRVMEKYYPQAGVLLGYPVAPTYVKSDVAS